MKKINLLNTIFFIITLGAIAASFGFLLKDELNNNNNQIGNKFIPDAICNVHFKVYYNDNYVCDSTVNITMNNSSYDEAKQYKELAYVSSRKGTNFIYVVGERHVIKTTAPVELVSCNLIKK